MKGIGLFTRRTSEDICLAFHRTKYHVDSLTIATTGPLIRTVYFALRNAIKDAEFFVFYSPEEYEQIRRYLPELPPDNLIQNSTKFDLLSQIESFMQICTSVDFDSPFVTLVLDHISFDYAYYQAINACLVLADKAGYSAIVGSDIFTSSINLIENNEEFFLKGEDYIISSVKKFTTDGTQASNSLVRASNISNDCGIFAWRGEMARRHLQKWPKTSESRNAPVRYFHQIFDFNDIVGLFVAKGSYPIFDYWKQINSDNNIEFLSLNAQDRWQSQIIKSESPHTLFFAFGDEWENVILSLSDEYYKIWNNNLTLLVSKRLSLSLLDYFEVLEKDKYINLLFVMLKEYFDSELPGNID